MALSSPTATVAGHGPAGHHLNRAVGVWSSEEHDRFLEGLKHYPQGPWKAITKFVGTRSVRQVQTHAQKYQEKVSRRLHGMQTGKAIRLRREHRIDHDVLAQPTLIRVHPQLRSNCARPELHHYREVKPMAVSTPAVVALNARAQAHTLPFQRPTIVPVALDAKGFSSTDPNGASPSSVSSPLDDLPTLSESLDFFIANFF
ncbi:unnamed protein product [Hyaloperonospora brassicae]|uniref:HTH myb-type domain-containing protein n=1 Tax=Hyaloperonospora brassicae TaxID=162125 RepID=A0AAV0UXL1_HYABA|nr:unnamed protein product [Hyaloperonospora brassicae]